MISGVSGVCMNKVRINSDRSFLSLKRGYHCKGYRAIDIWLYMMIPPARLAHVRSWCTSAKGADRESMELIIILNLHCHWSDSSGMLYLFFLYPHTLNFQKIRGRAWDCRSWGRAFKSRSLLEWNFFFFRIISKFYLSMYWISLLMLKWFKCPLITYTKEKRSDSDMTYVQQPTQVGALTPDDSTCLRPSCNESRKGGNSKFSYSLPSPRSRESSP